MDFWDITLLIFIPIIVVLSLFIVIKIKKDESKKNKRKAKILICGINGKMGSYLATSLSCQYDIIGYDHESKSNRWKVFNDIEEAVMEEPDVILDFTHSDIAKSLIKEFLLAGIPVISGTTGINHDDMIELINIAKECQTSFVSLVNFTYGIMLIYDWLKKNHGGYRVLLAESHHESKKDAPSGTAKLFASLLGIEYSHVMVERIKEYEPKHEITLFGKGEIITITHQIKDREAYLYLILLYLEKVLNSFIVEVNYERH